MIEQEEYDNLRRAYDMRMFELSQTRKECEKLRTQRVVWPLGVALGAFLLPWIVGVLESDWWPVFAGVVFGLLVLNAIVEPSLPI